LTFPSGSFWAGFFSILFFAFLSFVIYFIPFVDESRAAPRTDRDAAATGISYPRARRASISSIVRQPGQTAPSSSASHPT
jgi:hypothetical protein